MGFVLYVLSKLIGFIIMTRIFTLTEDKIMTISWFAYVFSWFIRTKVWLYERLEEI